MNPKKTQTNTNKLKKLNNNIDIVKEEKKKQKMILNCQAELNQNRKTTMKCKRERETAFLSCIKETP